MKIDKSCLFLLTLFMLTSCCYKTEYNSLEEYKINKEKILSEKRNLENKLSELEYKNSLESKKKKIYTKCENAYNLLKDKTIDKQIKFDISHELFEEIIYDKNNDTLFITYR